MLAFKEAIRHIWNTAYVSEGGRASFEAVAHFQDHVADGIFKLMVTDRLGIQSSPGQYGSRPTEEIVVVARPGIVELPIMRNVDSDERGRWLDEVRLPTASIGKCCFIEFFSWDTFEFVDLHLVRCSDSSNKCQYLIQQHHCRFVLDLQNW